MENKLDLIQRGREGAIVRNNIYSNTQRITINEDDYTVANIPIQTARNN